MFKLIACGIGLASAAESVLSKVHHNQRNGAVHKHDHHHPDHHHVKARVDASGQVTFEAAVQHFYEHHNFAHKKHSGHSIGMLGINPVSSVIQTRVADITSNFTSISGGHEEYHHKKHAAAADEAKSSASSHKHHSSESTSASSGENSTDTDSGEESSSDQVNRHEWILGCIICIFANFLSVTGFTTMKYSYRFATPADESTNRPWYQRKVSKASMYWFLGFIIILLAQPLNMLALVFSPISLVAPLCIFDVIFNMMYASFLLGEPFTVMDVTFTILAAGSALGVILTGPHNETPQGFNGKQLYEFWKTAPRCIFVVCSLVYLGIALYHIITLYIRRRKIRIAQQAEHAAARQPKMVEYPALKWYERFAFPCAASICSAYGQTFSKDIGTELRDGIPKDHITEFTITCCLGVLFALSSLVIVTRGIPLLDNRFFVPVHFSLTVVFLETIGIIFYSELVSMPAWQITIFFMFCTGCIGFASLINHGTTDHAVITEETSPPTSSEPTPNTINWKDHVADVIPLQPEASSSSTTSLEGGAAASAAAPVQEESSGPQQPAASSSTAPAPRYLRRPKR